MKTLLAGMAVFGLVAGSAVAETRYDRNIEQAATAIVAAKMGGIRGGFSFDAKPTLVTSPDMLNTGSIANSEAAPASAGPWQDGLAPATEGKISPTLF